MPRSKVKHMVPAVPEDENKPAGAAGRASQVKMEVPYSNVMVGSVNAKLPKEMNFDGGNMAPNWQFFQAKIRHISESSSIRG